MPRTRRIKVITKSKAQKKPDHKQTLVKKIQMCLKKFERAIVFEYQNMTTAPFREIQQSWIFDSKFFLGKNKVMQVSLGKDEENSASKNSYLLSKQLKGQRGLLFTNKTVEQVQKEFYNINVPEFAHGGEIAKSTNILYKGEESLQNLGFSIEPYLRKLGLNTQLINSKIILNDNYCLSEEGKQLTVEQCKLLKLLDIKLSNFTIQPICVLQKNGSLRIIKK